MSASYFRNQPWFYISIQPKNLFSLLCLPRVQPPPDDGIAGELDGVEAGGGGPEDARVQVEQAAAIV